MSILDIVSLNHNFWFLSSVLFIIKLIGLLVPKLAAKILLDLASSVESSGISDLFPEVSLGKKG